MYFSAFKRFGGSAILVILTACSGGGGGSGNSTNEIAARGVSPGVSNQSLTGTWRAFSSSQITSGNQTDTAKSEATAILIEREEGVYLTQCEYQDEEPIGPLIINDDTLSGTIVEGGTSVTYTFSISNNTVISGDITVKDRDTDLTVQTDISLFKKRDDSDYDAGSLAYQTAWDSREETKPSCGVIGALHEQSPNTETPTTIVYVTGGLFRAQFNFEVDPVPTPAVYTIGDETSPLLFAAIRQQQSLTDYEAPDTALVAGTLTVTQANNQRLIMELKEGLDENGNSVQFKADLIPDYGSLTGAAILP